MASDGGWFDYAGSGRIPSVRHGSPRWLWHAYGRRGFFRTVDLNALGWLAVLAPGVAVGTGVAIVTNTPVALAAPLGALASWVVALGLDTRRHRRMGVSVQVDGMTRAQLESVVNRLAARGIAATLAERAESERADSDSEGSFWIESTVRHVDAVQAELDQARHGHLD